MIRQNVSGLAVGPCAIMTRPRDKRRRFPAKPGSNSADRALDVGRSRTIFPFRSLQSRWIALSDHNRLTKRLITMKLPGPDHPITITANPKRIRVLAGGVVI